MQKDYIMRMIEQFTQALVSIIQYRKAGKYEQAVEQLQQASLTFLNKDLSFFLQLSPDQIIDYFKGDSSDLDTESSIICADLLDELAAIAKEKNHPDEALNLQKASLNLYINSLLIDSQFQTPSYREKIDSLIAEIDGR